MTWVVSAVVAVVVAVVLLEILLRLRPELPVATLLTADPQWATDDEGEVIEIDGSMWRVMEVVSVREVRVRRV